MSKISDKLNIINNAKNDIKTAIENKGVAVENIGIQEYASKINEIKSASAITKGLIINECDSDGYVTNAEIVGMTAIPDYFLYVGYDGAYIKRLKKLKLPSDLLTIGSNSLRSIDISLTELPDSITSIGDYGFYGCTNLALTKLPSNLISLGSNAFRSCTGLTSIELPSGITSIQSNVFNGCSNLRTVKILGKITSIGSSAFALCSSLSEMVIPNIISVPSLSSSSFKNTAIANGTGYIYIPDTLVTQMQSSTNWSTYASQIKGISELGG